MAENKNYTNAPLEDGEMEIDLMEYALKLWKARKFILKVAGIAAVVSVVIALSIPATYKAEVTLSPEQKKGTGNSTLSGMAAMLGLGNMGMGAEANALNISMATDIIASTPFILELFDTPVKTLDGKMDTTLVAYLETERRPWWSTVMSLPSMAIGGIKSIFTSTEAVAEEKPLDPFHLTRKQKGQVGKIKRIIEAESEAKTGITKIGVTLQDPLVAATVVNAVLDKLQKYITNYKTSKAQEDCKYLEELYNERQKEYYEAQEKYAEYSDMNQGVIRQSVKIEEERLQNEQNLAFQIFSQVATQLQVARAKLQEEKPVFAILEPASVPLIPAAPNKKMIVIGFVFLAGIAASAWVLFGKDMWISLKKILKEPTQGKE